MNLAKSLSEAADHFFPEFNEWLKSIKDHRHPLLIIYEQRTLIWTVLMMYVTRRGARRQIGIELRQGNCVEGIKQLSGQKNLENVPHGDTVEYYIQKADIGDFEEFNKKMIVR